MDRASSRRWGRNLARLLLFLLVLGSVSPDILRGSDSATRDGEAWKLERVRREIEKLRRSLDEARGQEETLLGELHSLDLEQALHAKELDLVDAELARCRREISQTREQVRELRTRLTESGEVLSRRLRSLYVSGPPSFERLVLAAEGPSQVLEAYRAAGQLARADGARVRTYRENLIGLETAMETLGARTTELETLKRKRGAQLRQLEGARLRRVRKLDTIRRTVAQREAALGEMEAMEQALQDLVSALSRGDTAPSDRRIGFQDFRGLLPWPVPGTVLVPFGARRNSRYDTQVPHPGMVLQVTPGEPVQAIFDGSVVFSDWFKGYGNLIVLEHGEGFMSVYGHASERLVETGEPVTSGQIIARGGDTGSLEGPRLYFEIWSNGQPENPLGWLEERTSD